MDAQDGNGMGPKRIAFLILLFTSPCFGGMMSPNISYIGRPNFTPIKPPAAQAGGCAGFACDNFTGTGNLTAHTSDTGGTWASQDGGEMTLSGGEAIDNSSTYTVMYMSETPATVAYDVTMSVRTTVTNQDTGGPAARCSTSANTAYFCYWGDAGAVWQLYKVVTGTETALGGGGFSGDDPGTGTRTVKIEVKDATKKLFTSGTERLSSADNAITAAGKPGIHTSGDTGEEHFDSLVATNL